MIVVMAVLMRMIMIMVMVVMMRGFVVIVSARLHAIRSMAGRRFDRFAA